MLKYIIPFAICVFLIWLLIDNRGHEKAQETLITVAAVILVALMYVTKEESIEKTISVPIFYDKVSNEFIFFEDNPILSKYFGKYNWLTKLIKQSNSNTLGFDCKEISKTIDLQAAVLLQHLFEKYSSGWLLNTRIINAPTYPMTKWQRDPRVKSDIQDFSKDRLSASFKDNIFYKVAASFKSTGLPKGSILTYRKVEDKIPDAESRIPYAEFRIYKRFAFDIKIIVSFDIADSPGLGEFKRFLAVDETTDLNKRFACHMLRIDCTGRFFRFRSGNPSVLLYKEWINNLFEDLSKTFEWTQQLKELNL